jgi:hypothetical protein
MQCVLTATPLTRSNSSHVLLLLQDIEHGYPLVDTNDGSSSDGTNSDDEAADITISEYTSEASSRYEHICVNFYISY